MEYAGQILTIWNQRTKIANWIHTFYRAPQAHLGLLQNNFNRGGGGGPEILVFNKTQGGKRSKQKPDSLSFNFSS